MKTRRTVLAVVTAAASALFTVGVTAAADTASAAGLTCRAALVGVNGAGRFVERNMRNGTVLGQKQSTTALPFGVTNLGFFGQASISGGVKTKFTTITPGGRPRILTVKDLDASSTLTYTSRRMSNTRFSPRLFTNSGGYHVFALAGSGDLKRLVTYRDSNGDVYFGDARLVLHNMGGLKTLSFYNRQSIGGVNTDILYATTKAGALKQIRVPVKRPGRARTITVKRSGFATYTGLSLGRCNQDAANAYIIGIDAPDNLARYYVLTRQARPSATNLSLKGRAGTGVSWRLHATL